MIFGRNHELKGVFDSTIAPLNIAGRRVREGRGGRTSLHRRRRGDVPPAVCLADCIKRRASCD